MPVDVGILGNGATLQMPVDNCNAWSTSVSCLYPDFINQLTVLSTQENFQAIKFKQIFWQYETQL